MKKMLKKFIHKFIVDEKGAVSIFLIMIVLLLFIFNVVLIDFARIIIADRQTEEASNVAIRSTMSSYHSGLQDNGLFAFDGDAGTAKEIFTDVFEKNISPNEGGNFELLGLQAELDELTIDLNMERNLTNDSILEYQILEEMKYKAPIEIGEAIIDGFLSISSQVEEASNYTKVAKKVNELAEDRTTKINDVMVLLIDAKEALEEVNYQVDNTASGNLYPYVATIFDIQKYHVRYQDELKKIKEADDVDSDSEEAEEIDEEEIERFREHTEIYKERSLEILNKILDHAKIAYGKLEDAKEIIPQASALNDQIIEAIENPENSTGGDYDNANNLGDQEEGSVDMSVLEDFIMEPSFFTDLEELVDKALFELDRRTENTNALIPKVEVEFLKDVNEDFANLSNPGRVANHVTHTHDRHEDALKKVKEAITLIETTLEEYLSVDGRSADEIEDEIEEKEEEAEETQKTIEEEFEELKEQYETAEAAVADTQKLIELVEKATAYGEASANANQEFTFEDPDDTADDAMSFIDVIFKEIGNILVNSRDKVYLNEYLLMRFKSHDFDKKDVSGYTFENNQVEFMMYGQQAFAANHLAAMTEIFAVRFAINLADALISPTNKVFGPLFWVSALAQALTYTLEDMRQIGNGDHIAIMRKFPRIQMDYQDHIRLFMFLHPDGGKLSRLRAVIDDRTGQDLNETPTYVTGNVTTSIPLWFLPQIADLLGRANIIDGRVEDNRYYIEKEVNYSY